MPQHFPDHSIAGRNDYFILYSYQGRELAARKPVVSGRKSLFPIFLCFTVRRSDDELIP